MSWLKKSQKGDTLVEVLIAITIVSMVLGGAFALTRQSSGTTQRAQERSEAINLVQQQTEILKAAVRQSASIPGGGDFCFLSASTLDTTTSLDDCNFGIEGRYRLVINRAGNQYRVTASWDKLGGGEREQLFIVYRVQ